MVVDDCDQLVASQEGFNTKMDVGTAAWMVYLLVSSGTADSLLSTHTSINRLDMHTNTINMEKSFLGCVALYISTLESISAPTTGHQSTDHLRISQLIYEVIDRLEIILKKQGSFIFKIWKGEEEKEIIKMLKKIFDTVEYFKPKSSRQESSEIFIISRGFRLNER